MIKSENYEVKKIDRRILIELTRNLEIKRENIDVLEQIQIDMIFEKISEKKGIIYSLFNGDFSENQQNIKERMHLGKGAELSLYDKVANNVIFKRVSEVFEQIISSNPQNGRVVSVCLDRLFFIQMILAENISINFVKSCMELPTQER